MPLGFRAGSSAFPVTGERKNCAVRPLRLVAVPSLRGRNTCGAARPSWLAAALRSVLGMRPGKSKCGTRTWEIKCFLERPRRADGAQRLSPCWWRRRVRTMGRLWAKVLGEENLPGVRSVSRKAPSLAAMPGGHRQRPCVRRPKVPRWAPSATEESPRMGTVSDLRGRT